MRAMPLSRVRSRLRLTAWLDLAMGVLSVPFLVLLVIELSGPPPEPWATRLATAQLAIWAVFVIAFAVELALAPSKRRYVRTHWLVALSLALPALRILRVARALRILQTTRAVRGLAAARVLSRLNRATRSLQALLHASQFLYLVALTGLVTLVAAGTVVFFERQEPSSALRSAPEALWWASNVVMSSGSTNEPLTIEGRLLAVALRIFGLAVVGYLTARIAVFLLRDGSRPAGSESELRELRDRVEVLTAELALAAATDRDRQPTDLDGRARATRNVIAAPRAAPPPPPGRSET